MPVCEMNTDVTPDKTKSSKFIKFNFFILYLRNRHKLKEKEVLNAIDTH